MISESVAPTGINSRTGRPVPPVKTELLAEWILATGGGTKPVIPPPTGEVLPSGKKEFFGLPDDVRPQEIEECGWGVLFAPDVAQSIKDALEPLIDLRRTQAGNLFKTFTANVENGICEEPDEFLERHGVGPGTVEPAKVPYYLLIIGSPETIPFEFQYGLGVGYAVGRVDFVDAPAARRYARAVIEAEGSFIARNCTALFGPMHAGDGATEISVDRLLKPLATDLGQAQKGWTIDITLGPAATKSGLRNLLGGANKSAVLFSAGHGLDCPKDDPLQFSSQGALVCQDWPVGEPLEAQSYFSAADLAQCDSLQNMVWFCFACFGAGTPRMDNFPGTANLTTPAQISSRSFTAALATEFLGHAAGPGLAFIGHVERAWETSFIWGQAGSQTKDFREALLRLMRNHRVGHAMQPLAERYGQISTLLAAEMIRALKNGQPPTGEQAEKLVLRWTACMDARNYVVLGDPAVRLRAP
jgi:hypothetical protein